MVTLPVLVVWVITASYAPVAVLAADRPPTRLATAGGVGTTARAEPQADAAPVRCPYRFDSDMPAATFCVYRGVAFGSRGEVCAPDAVVIWSSFDMHAPRTVGPAQPESGSTREVYLAFVANPELVLRASVDSGQSDRAEVIGYTAGVDQVS